LSALKLQGLRQGYSVSAGLPLACPLPWPWLLLAFELSEDPLAFAVTLVFEW